VGITSSITSARILAFAAFVEAGTGIALMLDPLLVVTLLLGTDLAGTGIMLGRCFGLALLALGLACWPGRKNGGSDFSPTVRAMLIYNLLIALYLAYLGTFVHLGGVLLWPGIALHAGVALLLVWTWRDEQRAWVRNK
jgi:Ca2+/Na+ antiporter